MEIWKNIKGYEGIYQISSFGNFKSVKRNKLLRFNTVGNGYLQIYLYKNAKRVRAYIHRLVASAFLENPENKEQVNHKNHIKTDNRLENLEWCTNRENHQYTKKRKNASSKYKGVFWNKHCKKWLACIVKDGKRIYLGLFENEKEAALAYNKKAPELFGKFAVLNEVTY